MLFLSQCKLRQNNKIDLRRPRHVQIFIAFKMEDWDSRMTYAITLPIPSWDRQIYTVISGESKRKKAAKAWKKCVLVFSNVTMAERYICIWLYGFLNTMPFCSTRHCKCVRVLFYTLLLLLLLLFFSALLLVLLLLINVIVSNALIFMIIRWYR